MHQAVGLMACLVWREKIETSARLSAELEGPVGALREAAKRVAKVCDMCLCFLIKPVCSDLNIVSSLFGLASES